RHVLEVGSGELDAKVLADERADHEPDGGAGQVGVDQRRRGGIALGLRPQARLRDGDGTLVTVTPHARGHGRCRGTTGRHSGTSRAAGPGIDDGAASRPPTTWTTRSKKLPTGRRVHGTNVP